MAGLTAATRRVLFSGRAVLVVAACGALLAWGVLTTVRHGPAWDATGRGMTEARALVAELAPGSRVTLVGDSPLLPLLFPLERAGRLTVERVEPEALIERAAGAPEKGPVLKRGDVVVGVEDTWIVLNRPDLEALLSALALVSSPRGPDPKGPVPVGTVGVGFGPNPVIPPIPADARARAVQWAAAGLGLPLAISLAGLAWATRRRGR